VFGAEYTFFLVQYSPGINNWSRLTHISYCFLRVVMCFGQATFLFFSTSRTRLKSPGLLRNLEGDQGDFFKKVGSSSFGTFIFAKVKLFSFVCQSRLRAL